MKALSGTIQLNPLVNEAANIVPKGNVLDFGCGNGENSVSLALRGFSVTALDNSSQFVHETSQLASMHGVNVKVINKDAKDVQLPCRYNLIVCTGVLHFIPAQDRKKVIERIKVHTRPGGINVISAFTCSSGNKAPSVLGKNELKESYLDWNILKYADKNGEVEMIVRKKN